MEIRVSGSGLMFRVKGMEIGVSGSGLMFRV